jgi:hypothetical protein
MTRPKRSFC